MKSIIDYINESENDGKNGKYVEYVDEDTGEIIKVWIDDPDPEEEAKKVEQAKAESEAYWKKVELEKQLRKELDPIEDEIYALKDELRDKKREYRDLQIEHEEEVGALFVDGKYEEGEKLAQEYGKKFNKLEKEITSIEKKLPKLQKKADVYWDKILDIW